MQCFYARRSELGSKKARGRAVCPCLKAETRRATRLERRQSGPKRTSRRCLDALAASARCVVRCGYGHGYAAPQPYYAPPQPQTYQPIRQQMQPQPRPQHAPKPTPKPVVQESASQPLVVPFPPLYGLNDATLRCRASYPVSSAMTSEAHSHNVHAAAPRMLVRI